MNRVEERSRWLSQYGALVGIDWADEMHVYHLEEVSSGRCKTAELPQTPEAIDAWASELRKFGQPVAVCVEQSKGALIAALSKYEFIHLYPLNPKKLKRYREAFTTSGAGDDPRDARLLWSYLHTHGHLMKVCRPDTVETRLLSELTQDRRREVNERTRLCNKLRAALKRYFPLVLEFIGANLHSAFAYQILRRWPTLEALQKARPSSLRKVFTRYGRYTAEQFDEVLQRIKQAIPLTTDRALVESGALKVTQLVKRIRDLNESVKEYEQRIAQVMEEHPEAEFYVVLPGAGDALAPRLLAAMGTDRERWDSAEEIQSLQGIAPVTARSGKNKKWVHWRWACPKFFRQTWHEFADHSRKYSAWAKAFYEMMRAKGKKHHAALRALAFKWIRVIYRCWKNRTPYDEAVYLESLRKRGSPIIDYMEKNNMTAT